MEHVHGKNNVEFICIGTSKIEIYGEKYNRTYWLLYCDCGKSFAYTWNTEKIEEKSEIKPHLLDTSQLTKSSIYYTDKNLEELKETLIKD